MIITLLTDFGTSDYYVPAMKGVILSAAPGVELVDVTHEIPAGDVEAAAFVLASASETFPDGTIHVAVVDPGVGSDRRAIVISGRQTFVGPDNGVFSFVFERDPSAEVVHVSDESFFRHTVSRTFHGRDVFAPVAAALAIGTVATSLGPRIENPVKLPLVPPQRLADGSVTGRIAHVDRFGNCVTNLSAAELPDGALFRLTIGGNEIRHARRFYADVIGAQKQPFVIAGSAGFLEISIDGASAAQHLGVSRGSAVRLEKEPGAPDGWRGR